MIEPFALYLALLLIAHAVADWPLQPGWLAVAKRRGGSATLGRGDALLVHGAVHGLLAGAALAIAGAEPRLAAAIALAETLAHAAIDAGKCQGGYGLKTDQALHVVCKVAWAAMAAGGLG